MSWKTVVHNATLQLGSWFVEGTPFVPPMPSPKPEPVPEPVIEPDRSSERFALHKLIAHGAWGENAIWRYSGENISFLAPGEMLVLPGKKFDHYFRVLDINSKVVLAAPEKKVLHGTAQEINA